MALEELKKFLMNLASRPILSINTNGNADGSQTKCDIILENLFDSLIDGCIAGLSTGYLANPDVGWKVALATGLIKFLIRLKELRGVK